MSDIFIGCKSSLSLHENLKWNIENVTNMSYMFGGCESLFSLPDISKWNTQNVIDMSGIFFVVNHYYLYLIFQNGILKILVI